MLRKYRMGFDIWGLIIFIAVMLPNCYWFACEAPDDVLRDESITPVIDMIGSVCQVAMVAALCVVKRQDIQGVKLGARIYGALVSYVIYIVSWIFYYQGYVNAYVIIALCVAPCLTFGLYAYDRKNIPAVIGVIAFAICHITYGVINYVI